MPYSSTRIDTNFRMFSPVILFHETSSSSDYQLIELKKTQVNAMLKSNGQFWSNIILSTRYSSPPQTPITSPSLSDHSSSSNTTTIKRKYRIEEEIMIVSEEEEEEVIVKKKKRRGNLPKDVTAVLKGWLKDHLKHPYPTEEEKKELVKRTELSLNQISNWFINARRRLLPTLLNDSEERKKGKMMKRKPKEDKLTPSKKLRSIKRNV
ncbi:hypothetical protein G6F46_005267 [Rhizopus delemar]|uniref:Homeobox domain-containing protein n=3 Tax=Rhizopus TaxID=4842 RepID=I1CSF1_RHIO9|nr:hypothetical protein RO3G_16092 [Rhizopus delemar RA 99-880]KAG1038710.1 hypothetical protein G6F43_012649 [Rhizopus delemar]KAG1533563.1 hypothetical protein G6F51_012546 [Rhizopus arrhizus]KAG1444251.1 hypothetical protein G6F55_012385 [Rhizopus delemar]KAG1488274.1 hypothetical protein G6F54_012161 [Rhizopus delemar]|eukprot:EIE91381.1 hypothetical protein RO3G_16092 [Rhizopus delemar RA 99-880]